MKFLRVAAWTVWFMLSWVALAHAGPVIALFSAIGGLLGGGILGQLFQWAILTAVRVGIGLLTKAKKTNQQAGVSADAKFGGDNPLSFVFGNFATPGQLEYANAWGEVDKTPNAYLVHVLSLADLPMALTGLWVDDKKITLPDMSGAMPDEKGWAIPEFIVNGKPYLWVRYLDGTQLAADSYLLSKFGGDAEIPWQSDMVFRGVPLLIMTARFKQDLFNGIPAYLAETSGIKLYDPRRDSTVSGGSGSHRWSNPATWEPSNNNVVHIYNALRGIHYQGNWIWGGRCEAWQLPSANFMAAMNACDQLIGTAAGGYEQQFRNGAEVEVSTEPVNFIEDSLKGCSGRIAEIGGVYKVTVGAPGLPVYSFDDSVIVVTEGQSFDPFPGLEATFNGAQASYPEPAEKWAAKDAPAYLRPDLEVLDDERQLLTGIQFPYTPYARQIQRLLKAAVDDGRRFRQHQICLPPETWLLEPNDVVSWTSGHNSYTNKRFLVVEIEGDNRFIQYVTLREIDPSDYTWNPLTDERPYSVGVVGSIIPPVQPMIGWQVFPATIQSAGKQMPSIRVSYPGDYDDVRAVQVQVRLAGTTVVMFDGEVPYGNPATNNNPSSVVLQAIFLPDTDYEVRGQLVPFGSRLTDWSTWLGVKTPNVWMKDLYPVDLDRLAEDVRQFQNWTAAGLRDVMDELRAVSAWASNQELANFSDKQQVRTELVSATGDTLAKATTLIAVATGPSSAMALRIDAVEALVNNPTTGLAATSTAVSSLQATVTIIDGKVTTNASAITALQASYGDVSGSATFRLNTGYTPSSGWVSKIGIQTRIDNAGIFRDAGIFLESTATQARVLIEADQFIVVNGSNQKQPFVFTGGVATLAVANIGLVTAGTIQSPDGKHVYTVANGTLEWSS